MLWVLCDTHLLHGSCCATNGYRNFQPSVSTNPLPKQLLKGEQNLRWNSFAWFSCLIFISSMTSVSVGSSTITVFSSLSIRYLNQQSINSTGNQNCHCADHENKNFRLATGSNPIFYMNNIALTIRINLPSSTNQSYIQLLLNSS